MVFSIRNSCHNQEKSKVPNKLSFDDAQIGARNIVDTARDWFRWDDDADNSVANKTAEEEFWAKFVAACDEATASHIAPTTPVIRRKSKQDIPPSATVTPWPADTITCDDNGELCCPPHYVRDDAEAQGRILEASGSPSLDEINMDFYWENQSSLPLADMHARSISRLPSVSARQTNPQILCGHIGNENQKPVAAGIYMEKINIRAIPWGRAPKRIDATSRRLIIDADGAWKKTYSALPAFMSFDADISKAFRDKWGPDVRPNTIHETHDIPRPMFTVENPVTNNAQFSYEMEWTIEDRLNPTKAYTEYKQIWDELNRQFGGDPDYTRHVIRSPMYIQGWHRKNPLGDQMPRAPEGNFSLGSLH
jgi:hypothetical protein